MFRRDGRVNGYQGVYNSEYRPPDDDSDEPETEYGIYVSHGEQSMGDARARKRERLMQEEERKHRERLRAREQQARAAIVAVDPKQTRSRSGPAVGAHSAASTTRPSGRPRKLPSTRNLSSPLVRSGLAAHGSGQSEASKSAAASPAALSVSDAASPVAPSASDSGNAAGGPPTE